MKRNRQDRPSDHEAIEAMAAAWLAERGGGLTAARAEAFARWRAADPRHETAVARLETTWAALQQLRELRPANRPIPDADLFAPAPPARRLGRWRTAAAVAMAASLAFAAAWWVSRDPRGGATAAQHYATTLDDYKPVQLEDGSLLELNAQSEVVVSFTPEERHVRLIRGEAHFTVAKDQARPFAVEAGAVAVRAVGTAFNVRVGSSDVEVLVTEGKVKVQELAERTSARTPSNAGAPAQARHDVTTPRVDREEGSLTTSLKETFLSANERTSLPLGSLAAVRPVIEKISPEIIRNTLAWRAQRLHFQDTPLADVVAQFNRRNTVQIELAEAELATLPVGGSFRADNVDAFVRLLTADNDIIADRLTPDRIVLRRR